MKSRHVLRSIAGAVALIAVAPSVSAAGTYEIAAGAHFNQQNSSASAITSGTRLRREKFPAPSC